MPTLKTKLYKFFSISHLRMLKVTVLPKMVIIVRLQQLVLYCIVSQCIGESYSNVLHCIVSQCIGESYSNVLHCIAMHWWIVFQCIVLHCIAMHWWIVLRCIALHCINVKWQVTDRGPRVQMTHPEEKELRRIQVNSIFSTPGSQLFGNYKTN